LVGKDVGGPFHKGIPLLVVQCFADVPLAANLDHRLLAPQDIQDSLQFELGGEISPLLAHLGVRVGLNRNNPGNEMAVGRYS
jgi:hypothetical protein